MARLTTDSVQALENRIEALTRALINQEQARIVVKPNSASQGYWFGGGNMVADGNRIYLVGRYRNAGDSRTGLIAGARGLELALFASDDGGNSFSKIQSWSKDDLTYDERDVVSIEGAALYHGRDGRWKLFVSTEKATPYPSPLEAFQKPGTGVWTIDVFSGPSPELLDPATIRPALSTPPPPEYLHVKDPVIDATDPGHPRLIFCNHPFSWSSANSGYAELGAGDEPCEVARWELVGRGPAWDVAGTRITERLQIPRIGAMADSAPMSIYWYDGLECYRPLEENSAAVSRPRGYSCEEIGGVLYGMDSEFPSMTRLSRLLPLFTSPYGTGCSRYVSTLTTNDGILATWQQSQPDLSQPLVAHFLPMESIEGLLA